MATFANAMGRPVLSGLKAKSGLIFRDGTIPNSKRLNGLGIMVRNFKYPAIFLSVMAGKRKKGAGSPDRQHTV